MMTKQLLFLLLALAPLSAAAQETSETTPKKSETAFLSTTVKEEKSLIAMAASKAKGKPVLLQPFYFLMSFIDSSAVATVDRTYIEQPKQSWSVEARTTFSQSTLKMETTWIDEGDGQAYDLVTKSNNGFSTSVGLWLGYRGYGLGISKEVGSTTGSTFSFGAAGGSFGINLRIGNYRSDIPDIYMNGDKITDYLIEDRLDDPIKVRTFFLDGYYMLNGKHFSYAAAYDNSLFQRRSAGSLVIGGMYCHSRIDYSADSNWLLTAMMKNVGKVKFTQGCIGLGYAYSWVPARGWLVNVTLMPMLAFYNRTTKYIYDIGMENPYLDGTDATDEDYLYDPRTTYEVNNETEEKTGNKVKLNYDARVSVLYNFDRWYVRVYGHYNNFHYGSDLVSGRLTDWTAYASLGFRF